MKLNEGHLECCFTRSLEEWGILPFPPPLPFFLLLSIFPVSFRRAKLEPTAKASRWIFALGCIVVTTQMGCRYGFYRYFFLLVSADSRLCVPFPDIRFFFGFFSYSFLFLCCFAVRSLSILHLILHGETRGQDHFCANHSTPCPGVVPALRTMGTIAALQ